MFYTSRSEKRVLLLCVLLLSALAAGSFFLLHHEVEEEGVTFSAEELQRIKTLQDGMEKKQNRRSYGLAEKLFPFDPNHDDSLALSRLGFRPWQIGNMMRYREAGGVWRSPDDFKRLYGLSEADFKRLRPYIRIAPADRKRPYTHYEEDDYGTPRAELPQYERLEKYEEGTRIDANEADTTELKRIPGIGSYYARKIVSYRERLGGFVSASQIEEIEGLPAGASRWFEVESSPHIEKIRINHATFKQIVHHPYMSYEQTKAIVNHIRSYGPLRSWRDLRLYKEFKEEDFSRLTPYFSFD